MQENTKIYSIIADSPLGFTPEKLPNIVVLDGYANKMLECGIIPKVIIGDFDAISQSTIAHFQSLGTEIVHDTCQNSTDLDKAIKYCDAAKATDIHIYNAIGGRLDHTLYNTRALKKYHKVKRRIVLINNNEHMEFFSNCRVELQCEISSHIAIISAPKAIVTSSGLKYELNEYVLEYGKNESTSNRNINYSVTFDVHGECFIIHPSHSAIKTLIS